MHSAIHSYIIFLELFDIQLSNVEYNYMQKFTKNFDDI